MIIFKNKGVIDLRAIKTFSVSVKKEGLIGFFGTRLKYYAISILLREGCDITIYSGGNENVFTLNIEVTDQHFDVVCINNEELGFTT